MKSGKLFHITCLALLVVGCGAKKVALQPTLSERHTKNLSSAYTLNCPLNFTILDSRKNKESFNKSISSESIISWFNQAINSINSEESTLSKAISLEVDIKKVYISNIATSLSGVVLTKVSINDKTIFLRGQEADSNVWGAEYELYDVLNDAIKKWLMSLHVELKSECSEGVNKQVAIH